jgi:3-hydroxyisobutyrate dehydrogenase-like beta-hydroxyacid dehydrogenase
MSRIAFLGTGLLGSGFAEAAAARGDTVSAWNRTTSKSEALAKFGIRAATTPADAIAGAERVHLILKDDAVVDATLDACGAGLKDVIVVDHTTNAPHGTAARAARLAAAGVRYLHAPVFMSPKAARDGVGLMLAAGPRALFDEVSPALSAMTGRLEFLGERPDLAAAYKLFGNAMLFAVSGGLADIYAMATELGVPATDAVGLFNIFNITPMFAGRGRLMAEGNFTASFELAMARKDIGLMLDAAGARPLSVLPGIAARMDDMLARGHGADDSAVIGLDSIAPKPST